MKIVATLQVYWALMRISFRKRFAYRAANLSGMVTNLFFGLIRAFVLVALFQAKGQSEYAGYDVARLISFTAISQVLVSAFGLFGWWDLATAIRSGAIASDVARPVNFFAYWYAQDLGRVAAHIATRGVPLLLSYALLYSIATPGPVMNWLVFALAAGLAHAVSFVYLFIVNAVAFWVTDARGFARITLGIVQLLSGFVIPVAFFPEWLKTLIALTPFPAMVNIPSEIFLGLRAQPEQLWAALGIQAFWLIVMLGLLRWVVRAGLRKLVIQGG